MLHYQHRGGLEDPEFLRRIGELSVKSDRVWLVAHTNGYEQGWLSITGRQAQERTAIGRCGTNVADPQWAEPRAGIAAEQTETGQWGRGFTDGDWWKTEPDVGRVVDGCANRTHRLRCLGNAIVPQVAYMIFKAIKETPGPRAGGDCLDKLI